MDQQKPNVSSFIIRFVCDEPSECADHTFCRGSIRHIQTDEEVPFVHWNAAVAFIQKFTPLDIEPEPKP